MIKLSHLLIEQETFTATNKKTGNTSTFDSEEARDAAVKAGTHAKVKGKGDSKKGGKGGVNIFGKDKQQSKSKKSEPKKTKSSSSEPDYDKYNFKADTMTDFFKGNLSIDGLQKVAKKNFDSEIADIADEKDLDGFLNNKFMQDVMADKYGIDKDTLISKVKDLKKALFGGEKDEPKRDDNTDAQIDDVQNNIGDLDGDEIRDYAESDIFPYLKGKDLETAKSLVDDIEDSGSDFVRSADVRADLKDLFDKKMTLDSPKEEPKSEPSKPRPGNPQVNKVVRKKAESLGITPQKLGKEEYESRMSKAAVEALTDANFHSEARKLISVLEDKPEWANDPRKDPKMPDISSPEYEEWQKTSVYSSTFYDSAEGTDDLAHAATGESGWDGIESLDAIAYDLKMNGSKKLAAKLQSIFEGTTKKGSIKLTNLLRK